ncbi:MAG: diguanylate cyclase [Sedimentitalea sp.]|nr:diguanylate cyclase [Sedimentitalea sp.]
MQGTILIIDGVATNRIMLKVQLSAAYYHVVQADRLDGLVPLIRRVQPDLVLTAMNLPDGDARAVKRALQGDEALARIPVIAITPQNDQAARLSALAAGIDDVLSNPLDDMILQARIRSQLRARNSAEDLRLRDSTTRALGFAEPVESFVLPAEVALVTRDAVTGAVWRNRLKGHIRHRLQTHQMGDIHLLMTDPVPDAIVVELTRQPNDAGLRLLADLHARSATRHAAIIAVAEGCDPTLVADALDRGAHDVMQSGFNAEELSLRLSAQLRRKARSDRLRDTVRDGLAAAVIDPMTGLYNRRYALPKLAEIARAAAETGHGFAVMLADLDHFKQINDRFGHPAGDAVLMETARRLRSQLRPMDVIARVGGEEFLIVMPNIDQADATLAADRLCRQINGLPFHLPDLDISVQVTTSIGVVLGPSAAHAGRAPEDLAATLFAQADRALYEAKDRGRNRFTMKQSAA